MHQLIMNHTKKCWFACDDCGHDFEMLPNNIVNGQWCPDCYNKTEGNLFKWLNKTFVGYIWVRNKSTKWSNTHHLDTEKHPVTEKVVKGTTYRFDFRCDELKLIIELDGRQHWDQVWSWTPPEATRLNDNRKMELSFNHGYTTIRIFQQDVYSDKNNWDQALKLAIQLYHKDEPQIWCIGKIYHERDYRQKWLDYNKDHKLCEVTYINKDGVIDL
jgi:very-short-patch-repair endonuclease